MAEIDPKLLVLFTKTVRYNGISGTARALSIPKATISRNLSKLEAELGTKLFERSLNGLHLTETGQRIFAFGQRIADEVEEARNAVETAQKTMSGQMRVATPLTFGRSLLSPILPKFLKLHPNLSLELELTNRIVDPVEENFDVVVRLGPLPDSGLIAKPLGAVDFLACASPSYLAAHKTIKKPEDLSSLEVIESFSGDKLVMWEFVQKEREVRVPVYGKLDVNDPIVRRDATIAGLGISLLPSWLAKPALEKKMLSLVLPEWQSKKDTKIYALYARRRNLSSKTRAFLEFIEKEILFSSSIT